MGEDVKSPYGGAFKVSQGLSDLFPNRVFNTPISESAIVGIGCGLAMEGYYPFVEIMFGDFMSLTLDQILNHASKFRYMYNNQVDTSFVVRTPMGAGRGYGPTHSQTLDRHFMGIPGLRIVALNNLVEPIAVYQPLLATNGEPTLIIENKLLYALNLRENMPEGFKALISDETFPTVLIKPESDTLDITLIGYGGLSDTLVNVAERLFDEADVVSQIICPTKIYPFNIKPFIHLLSNSKFLVLVEEGQGFAGFGSEIIAQIAEHDSSLLRRVKRVVPQAIPIPASGSAEKEMMPNVNNIITSILGFIHEV
jgi:2-oxoisovalerate dehydrogenase E1 component